MNEFECTAMHGRDSRSGAPNDGDHMLTKAGRHGAALGCEPHRPASSSVRSSWDTEIAKRPFLVTTRMHRRACAPMRLAGERSSVHNTVGEFVAVIIGRSVTGISSVHSLSRCGCVSDREVERTEEFATVRRGDEHTQPRAQPAARRG